MSVLQHLSALNILSVENKNSRKSQNSDTENLSAYAQKGVKYRLQE